MDKKKKVEIPVKEVKPKPVSREIPAKAKYYEELFRGCK